MTTPDTSRLALVMAETLRNRIDRAFADLSAENARPRAQLDASETAARITELQTACSRHEADARAARRELRERGDFVDGYGQAVDDLQGHLSKSKAHARRWKALAKIHRRTVNQMFGDRRPTSEETP